MASCGGGRSFTQVWGNQETYSLCNLPDKLGLASPACKAELEVTHRQKGAKKYKTERLVLYQRERANSNI